MRAAVLSLLFGGSLGGCDQIESWRTPELAACEAFIKDQLVSPTSYRRVKVDSSDKAVPKELFAEAVGWDLKQGYQQRLIARMDDPGIRSVFIEYDADNRFGAAIRSVEECNFAMDSLSGDELSDNDVIMQASIISGTNKFRGDKPEWRCCLDRSFDDRKLYELEASSAEAQANELEAVADAAVGAE